MAGSGIDHQLVSSGTPGGIAYTDWNADHVVNGDVDFGGHSIVHAGAEVAIDGDISLLAASQIDGAGAEFLAGHGTLGVPGLAGIVTGGSGGEPGQQLVAQGYSTMLWTDPPPPSAAALVYAYSTFR